MSSLPDRSRVGGSSKWKWRGTAFIRTGGVLLTLALVTFGLAQASPAGAVWGDSTVWGDTLEIVGTTGTGGIGDNGNVNVATLSCASSGNCSAGGYYEDTTGITQAFVVNEVSGVWGTPTELAPIGGGSGHLGDSGYAQVKSLSCASAGNCSAGGYYYDGDNQQAFVVNEVGGVWGTPAEFAPVGGGSGHLGDSGDAYVISLSCSSASNCSAGGYYGNGQIQQAFVVNEVAGIWGTPTELAAVGGGDGFLGDAGDAYVISLSCPSDGNCSAGGYYYAGEADATQAFVVNEVSGVWGTPTKIVGTAGTGGLGDNGEVFLASLSCSSAGNCSAGGYFDNGHQQAFVVNEVSGVWGTPTELGALGGGDGFLGDTGYAQVKSLSCPSDGNCSAGGSFYNGTREQAFVVDEVSGVWGTPIVLSAIGGGDGFLGDNSYAELTTLSCSSAGNCSAGGTYYDGDNQQAFVINEASGVWGNPTEVSGLRGTGGLGDDGVNAQVASLSCSSDGYCAAGGTYDIDNGDEAFVTSTVTVTTTTTNPPPPPPTSITTTTTSTTTTTVPPTTTTTVPPVRTHPRSGLPVYVYFANDKAVLSTHDKHVLNALARSLMASGTTHVRITGYANYLGTDRINLPLSLHRANVTRSYLTDALAARGDTGVSFTVSGRGVLRTYSPIALDRVAIVTH